MTGPNLHLDNTIGCFFVGMVLATILYGCTCAQVLYYLWQYPEDRMNFKLFGSRHGYHGYPHPVLDLYYILTIWKLVGERWFQLPITVMAYSTIDSLTIASDELRVGVSIWHSITHPALPGVFMSSKGRGPLITVTVRQTASFLQPLFAAIADIYITVALTMLLRREKSEFKRTSSILRKLTVHIINRGVLTAILQSLQAILFAAYRSNGFYWSLFAFPGTRGTCPSQVAPQLLIEMF
ncbi:hypothetical protein FOMPIDRAFT_1019310 [Fomitopsis schrenkii]|uniref:DUF6534 domain-containing protein n=1 Tax=Fomitopsis schrenkii TaxID=2126942 RepID=S8DX65_FOMSC|nr:hypothetical protein FOMPIDRAFT_1019310 [Fomitopsis schrenkii]